MQFYLDGFHPGDPGIDPTPAPDAGGPLPETVDVLIVGSGPAGLVLAAQLAQFPGISTRVVERRGGPLLLGQADGVACRTVEMFEAFGLSGPLLREACWVNETVFWGPSDDDRSRIVRRGRVQDVEDGLSEFPHLIVNQARIQQHLLDLMAKSARRLEPDYGLQLADLVVHEDGEYPVEASLRPVGEGDGEGEGGEIVRVRARYVVGCDGARSAVRRAIGQSLEGDSARQLWGVMDVLAVTDLPDIRYKMVIQSAEAGNIVVIPREGGYLVRLYIELGELHDDERAADRGVTLDTLIEATNRILHPYTLDVRDSPWWSAYEIGQRLSPKFDDVPVAATGSRTPRVFIAGDACHTHSPKAGQGMNVSMQDAFNLGWKLAAVLEGRADESLLNTYSAERHSVAKRLIDFDKEWSAMLGARPAVDDGSDDGGDGVSPSALQASFAAQGRYTAGVATHYEPSVIRGGTHHQELARGFVIGERFHSSPVLRIGDAKQVQLGHVARADGRWRLYAFADAADARAEDSRLRRLLGHLAGDADSPLLRFTAHGDDVDTVIDVRAILQQGHEDVSVTELPDLLAPRKGRLGLIDYEKAFTARVKSGPEIYEERVIDRAAGAMVLVRPDQYVAHVLPLDAHEELGAFLAAFMRTPSGALIGA